MSLILLALPYITPPKPLVPVAYPVVNTQTAIRPPGTSFLDRQTDTGRLEVICATSGLFNVLAPRYADYVNGVTLPQLKIISTAPTFIYTPRVDFHSTGAFLPQTTPFSFAGGAQGPTGGMSRATNPEIVFVATLIRKNLPFLIGFQWNAVPSELVVSSLLACERLEDFNFQSHPSTDFMLCELLRHRNNNVRQGVLTFYRKSLTTGTKNVSPFIVDPQTPANRGHNNQNPLIYVAEKGHTNSLKMLLEFQQELLSFRAQQQVDRKFEIEEKTRQAAEMKAKLEEERARSIANGNLHLRSGGFGGALGGITSADNNNLPPTGQPNGGFGFGGGAAPNNNNNLPHPAPNQGTFSFGTTNATVRPQWGGAANGINFNPPVVSGGGGFGRGPLPPPPPPPQTTVVVNVPKLQPIRIVEPDVLLFFAAFRGHASTVAMLLAEGARVSGFSQGRRIAIDNAAANGSLDCVKLLHEAYVEQLAAWVKQHGETVLSVPGDVTKASEFYQDEDDEATPAAPVPQPGMFGGGIQHLQMVAAAEKNKEKSRRQPRKPFRGNALYHGASVLPIVRYLLTEGNIQKSTQQKLYNPNEELIKDSTDPENDPNVPPHLNNMGGGFAMPGTNTASALQAAVISSSYDSVEFLLSHGGNVEHKTTTKQTSLQLVCTKKNVAILRLLVTHGKPSTKSLESALAAAARVGSHTIVDYLLNEAKVDPNCIDKSTAARETPLVACCRSPVCDLRCIKLLLEAGADCNKFSEPIPIGDENPDDDDDDDEKEKNGSGASPTAVAVPAATQGLFMTTPHPNGAPAHILLEHIKKARVPPLAALFSFAGADPSSQQSSVSPSLYTATKLLLSHGADPNVYIHHAVSFMSKAARREQLRATISQQNAALMAQTRPAAVASAHGHYGGGLGGSAATQAVQTSFYSFQYEPLLHYLCRAMPNRPQSGWGSPAMSDFSFLELLFDTSIIKPNLKLFIWGDALPVFHYHTPVRMGSTCLHAAAGVVTEGPIFERLFKECGGDPTDFVAPLHKTTKKEKEELMKQFGSHFKEELDDDEDDEAENDNEKKSEPQDKKTSANDDNYENNNNDKVDVDDDDDDDDEIDFAVVQQRRNFNGVGKHKKFVLSDPRNETPLRVALRQSNVEVAAFMITSLGKEKIAEMEIAEVRKKLVPLMQVTMAQIGGFGSVLSDHRTFHLLQLLRDNGADPDLPNPGNGRTLLNIACSLRSAPIPDFGLSRNIQKLCRPTKLKIRLEEVEYAGIIKEEEKIERTLRQYEAASEASTNPVNPVPIPLSLEKKRYLIGDADHRFATTAVEMNGGGGSNFGGFGNARTRYSLQTDNYPQLRDFYTGFMCTNCDRDLVLARGARRFCAGCFYILCSECMNAEKNTRTVVDVADGKEKSVLLCDKCDQVVFGEI